MALADSPHRALADRRQLHDCARRQDRSRGRGRRIARWRDQAGAASACPMRAMARPIEGVAAALEAMRGALADGLDRAGAARRDAAGRGAQCARLRVLGFRGEECRAAGARACRAAAPQPLVTAYTISLGTPDAMAEAAAKAAAPKTAQGEARRGGRRRAHRAVRAAAPHAELIVDANEALARR